MEMHTDVIGTGSQVEIILRDKQGKEERLNVILVPAEAADFANGYLGVNTPLAQALIGERAGMVIPYLKDDINSIEVVGVRKSDIQPPANAADKREAALKKVARDVQNTSAMVFASSFSGKWGDYDPESIPKEDNPEDSQ